MTAGTRREALTSGGKETRFFIGKVLGLGFRVDFWVVGYFWVWVWGCSFVLSCVCVCVFRFLAPIQTDKSQNVYFQWVVDVVLNVS